MIRHAKYDDIDRVVAIYNQAIDAGFQTAFMEQQIVEDRIPWFKEHLGPTHPIFVYELDGKVVGWLSISPYRSGRAALRHTVEISYFVDTTYLHRGIGSQLLVYGVNACRQLKYKTAIAIILDKNTASIRLAKKFGFEQWAFLPAVADFNGIECDHLYYGIKL
jgi:phosphinothricin acetyltransferase